VPRSFLRHHLAASNANLHNAESITSNDPIASSACLSVMWLCCAKMAGWIEVRFRMETLGEPGHIVSDRGRNPLRDSGSSDG